MNKAKNYGLPSTENVRHTPQNVCMLHKVLSHRKDMNFQYMFALMFTPEERIDSIIQRDGLLRPHATNGLCQRTDTKVQFASPSH